MDKIRQIKNSTKNFVIRHKTGIAVATTVIVMAKVNRIALSQHDAFLKSHDLYEEFYRLEEA